MFGCLLPMLCTTFRRKTVTIANVFQVHDAKERHLKTYTPRKRFWDACSQETVSGDFFLLFCFASWTWLCNVYSQNFPRGCTHFLLKGAIAMSSFTLATKPRRDGLHWHRSYLATISRGQHSGQRWQLGIDLLHNQLTRSLGASHDNLPECPEYFCTNVAARARAYSYRVGHIFRLFVID